MGTHKATSPYAPDRRERAPDDDLAGGSSWLACAMSTGSDQSETPLLDDWIAEVGAEQVVAAIKGAVEQIDGGAIPGFTDKQALLAYIGRHASGCVGVSSPPRR
jgi:hypothetical protein